jgi:hypothetical protein
MQKHRAKHLPSCSGPIDPVRLQALLANTSTGDGGLELCLGMGEGTPSSLPCGPTFSKVCSTTSSGTSSPAGALSISPGGRAVYQSPPQGVAWRGMPGGVVPGSDADRSMHVCRAPLPAYDLQPWLGSILVDVAMLDKALEICAANFIKTVEAIREEHSRNELHLLFVPIGIRRLILYVL